MEGIRSLWQLIKQGDTCEKSIWRLVHGSTHSSTISEIPYIQGRKHFISISRLNLSSKRHAPHILKTNQIRHRTITKQKEVRPVYYLEGICLLSKAKEGLAQTIQMIIKHLKPLSFIINKEKNYTHAFTNLRFLFNPKKTKILVPTLKTNKLI